LGEFGINNTPPIDPNEQMHYYTIFGDATFTTVCSFINFFMPFFLIFNPSRKIAQQLAPIAFGAGIITIIIYFNGENFQSAEYIFLNNNGSAMRHILLTIVGYALMFSTPKFMFKAKRFYKTD
jgi:hypothetical protein